MSDTIAAISTGMTAAGIGIVRMSGPEAIVIGDRIYRGKHGKLKEQSTHTIHFGYIMDGQETVDQVLVMLMKGPHTFTGEDVIEINCHGGTYVVKKVLETVLKAGARVAEPGEFSKRAFLNGKMDLTQAEAVADIIDSHNQYALQASINQLKGEEKKLLEEIRNKIIYNTAFIESALDDPEHISLDGYKEKIEVELEEMMKSLNQLISSSENGRIMKEGIRTVILGKPNAGKSSLMNVLVGSQKAIVTDIAGTTRDILEEMIQLDGVTLQIVDTAGIRQTKDTVERMGVERAINSAHEADLILYVVDSSRELDEDDREILTLLRDKKVIILLNKSDLEPKVTKEKLQSFIKREIDYDERIDSKIIETGSNNERKLAFIDISAKEVTGIRELTDAVTDMFFQGDISFNNQVCITNMRHKAALSKALFSLEKVKRSVTDGMSEDFYTIDFMDAYEQLGSITGDMIGEDLVNEIFSKFCMGK